MSSLSRDDVAKLAGLARIEMTENIARPDVVLPSLSPTDALSGAPAQEEQRFRVPQILGEAE